MNSEMNQKKTHKRKGSLFELTDLQIEDLYGPIIDNDKKQFYSVIKIHHDTGFILTNVAIDFFSRDPLKGIFMREIKHPHNYPKKSLDTMSKLYFTKRAEKTKEIEYIEDGYESMPEFKRYLFYYGTIQIGYIMERSHKYFLMKVCNEWHNISQNRLQMRVECDPL